VSVWSAYGAAAAKAEARLEHIKSHLEGGFDVQGYVTNIENQRGNPAACAERLSSYAFARGMLAWFETADLEEMKRWFSVAESLHRYQFSLQSDKMNFLPKTLDFMRALVSDNEMLIDWFCQCRDIVDEKRIQSTTTADFLAYQIVLAAKGDMRQLSERCLLMREKPPKGAKQMFLLDNEFFMALANGDKLAMEHALLELTSAASIRKRLSSENGYSEGMISTFGVIYAKIAWRSGYEVKCETPFIPAQWLPVNSLGHYEPYFSFLRTI